MKFDAILAIASGQPDPLILPFLTDQIECKHLILLVSEWSKNKQVDVNLRNALQPRGVKVTSIDLETDHWDDIQASIENIKADAGSNIAFNGNGGTKPMTLAAYEYCYNDDIPMFYVDGNALNWIFKGNAASLTPVTVEQSLSIDSYLNAHGYEKISEAAPLNSSAYKEMVTDWAKSDQKEAIGTLNYIASRGNASKLSVVLEGSEATAGNAVCTLLDDLDRVGLIEFVTDEKIRFISEDARFFTNGGWYELYVCMLLQSVNKDYFDGKGKVFTNLEVKPTAKTAKVVKNEIDVAYLLNNRLYLFECKTANLAGRTTRADEAIYKLGTLLSALGGLRAKGVIMSYRDVNQLDKDRGRLLNIDIVEHRQNKEDMKSKLISVIKG